jgi:phosphopentomutase
MFTSYESFSESGAPQVLVSKRVLRNYGEPTVDSDMLGQLFEEDLGLPAAKSTIKFHDGLQLGEAPQPLDFWRNGFRTPYSNTYHIAAWSVPKLPMAKIIALGLATAEKREQGFPRRFWGTELTAASTGILTAGMAENIGGLTIAGAVGFMGLAVAKTSKSVTDPGDLMYRETPEALALRKVHDRDITFPVQHNRHYLTDPEPDYS